MEFPKELNTISCAMHAVMESEAVALPRELTTALCLKWVLFRFLPSGMCHCVVWQLPIFWKELFYRTTQWHDPNFHNLNIHCCKNLRPYIVIFSFMLSVLTHSSIARLPCHAETWLIHYARRNIVHLLCSGIHLSQTLLHLFNPMCPSNFPDTWSVVLSLSPRYYELCSQNMPVFCLVIYRWQPYVRLSFSLTKECILFYDLYHTGTKNMIISRTTLQQHGLAATKV